MLLSCYSWLLVAGCFLVDSFWLILSKERVSSNDKADCESVVSSLPGKSNGRQMMMDARQRRVMER